MWSLIAIDIGAYAAIKKVALNDPYECCKGCSVSNEAYNAAISVAVMMFSMVRSILLVSSKNSIIWLSLLKENSMLRGFFTPTNCYKAWNQLFDNS